MDSVSDKIKISFTNLELEPSYGNFSEDWQLLLGITGDFFIYVEGRLLLKDEYFSLVEFAAHVNRWLKEKRSVDFSFDSLESDDKGLVWFRISNGFWHVGSVYQNYEETLTFSKEEIIYAFRNYRDLLIDSLPPNLKAGVEKIIAGSV